MDIDRAALMLAFLSDAEEDLVGMEQEVLALEGGNDDPRVIETIFRRAHTLKGNAATLTLDAFAGVAHRLEDLLHALRSQSISVNRELINVVLKAVDVLRQMLKDLRAGRSDQGTGHEALLADLAGCLATAGGPGAGSAPGSEAEHDDASLTHNAWQPVLRVEVGKLDLLLGLVARASVVHGQMGALLLGAPETNPEVAELHRKNERLLLELQDWVMDARMVPVSTLFRSHVRTVRDGAQMYGKRAHLRCEGENVRVDTGVADNIRDALTHLVRNAIDHGLETPDLRLSRGKKAEGTVTLSARQNANQIIIEVRDDGGGFSEARIRARARALGRSDVDKLPAEALYRMAFEPGFSTAEQVSTLSGRGVGMDVVLRRVEALHGTVDIDSQEGRGTTIEMRLPLSVSVIEGFWVQLADVDYVLPLDEVVECFELPARQPAFEREGMIELRGEAIPVFRLRNFFGVPGQPPDNEQVVVVRDERGCAGLVVDLIAGERQTVIKPLGRLFRSVVGISGSTLRSDGRVALVIDVGRLVRSARRPRSGPRSSAPPTEVLAES